MGWFNYYGLIFIAVIMVPNIIFAVKNKDRAVQVYKNKAAESFEQIGRYACMALMIFNIPYTWFGFYFPFAEYVYIGVNGALTAAYCISWAILWKRAGMIKAVLLSVIPSAVFLFSGVIIASVPLIAFAIVFAVAHIIISVKNAHNV